MFTKSNRPSVAHCALTSAPSDSISLLTSRMRFGLFFTVCTPSGASVVSITNVGIDPLSPVEMSRGAGRGVVADQCERAECEPGAGRGGDDRERDARQVFALDDRHGEVGAVGDHAGQ